MIKLAICDDEHYFLKGLKTDLIQYFDNKKIPVQISEFTNGENLLHTDFDFHILLIDIKLQGQSGIDVVRRLRVEQKNCQIIFVTSFEEYAIQAFDLDAVHYLVKPVSFEKLSHALDKALQWSAQSKGKTLTISKGNGTQRIFIRDILYCEAVNHRIYIHTANVSYDYFGTLEALSEKLDDRFFRCHRSYIINLNFVISREKDTATVLGGDKILVSRRKQQEFAQKLLSFFREEVLV